MQLSNILIISATLLAGLAPQVMAALSVEAPPETEIVSRVKLSITNNGAAFLISLQRRYAVRDALLKKRDRCTGQRCENGSECDAKGCNMGCNTTGFCHPLYIPPPTFCARGCDAI
jgi:hypothetical protein